MAWQLELGISTPDSKSFTKTIKKAGESLEKLDKESKESDKAVASLSKSLIIAGAAAAIASAGIIALNTLIQQSAEAYASLENRLIAVGRIAGLSAEGLGQLEESFRSLAVQTGISTAIIAEFAEQGARFGIRGADDLINFTESMTLLGAVTGNVTAKMVKDLARIRELTDAEGSSFNNLANAVVELGNNFATSEDQIARTTARISTDLAQFNVGTDFALGLGTALDSMGISAERGGSAMQRLSTSLKDLEIDGGAAFRQLAEASGLTQKAFSDLVKSNPAEGVVQLARAGADSEKVLDSLGVKSIRATAVFSTLSANSKQLAKSMDLASESIESTTTLMEQAATQSESLENLQKRLAEAQDQIASAFGAEVADNAKVYLNTLIDITEAFNDTGDATSGAALHGVEALGKETRKWFGILADIRDSVLPALTTSLDIAAAGIAGVSLALENTGDIVFGGAVEGLLNLFDANEAVTAELEKQNILQGQLTTAAIKRGKVAREQKAAELAAEKSISEEQRARNDLIDKARADSKEQKKNYDDNVKILAKGNVELEKMLGMLSQDLQLAGLDDIDRQFEQAAIDLKSGMTEAGEAFGKAFDAAKAIGTSEKDLSKMRADYDGIVEALKGLEEVTIREVTEAVKGDRDDAFADLDDANNRLTDLQQEVQQPEATTAAITSQEEGISFAAGIAAQNQADTIAAQARKKEIDEARKQRDEAAELLREQNDTLKKLAKGTYSG